jgi:CPA1 family monovalent cation:H+ antiporter
VQQLRDEYDVRLHRLADSEAGLAPSSSLADAAFKRVRHATLAAEHAELIRLRDEGAISDDVLLDLERELDLEATRHGLAELRGVELEPSANAAQLKDSSRG